MEDLKIEKTRKIPRPLILMLNKMVMDYYRSLRFAERKGRPIAWTCLGFPKNILFALDIIPAYPQFHIAFQPAGKTREHIIRNIEGKYQISPDLCGEVKSMICSAVNSDVMSFRLPEPDMLVATNSACNNQIKGFNFLEHYFKIPLFFYDYPRSFYDIPKPHKESYLKQQFEEIVISIEKRYDTGFDSERYYNSTINDYKAYTVWREIIKLCAHRPGPVDAMELNPFLTPFLSMDSKSDKLTDLYIKLYNSIFKMCDNTKNMKEIDPKKREIRLLWDMLPVDNKSGFFKRLFSRYNAFVAMSTLFPTLARSEISGLKFGYPLTKEQVEDYIKDKPFKTIDMQINHMHSFMHNSIKSRNRLMKKMIERFHIDGVIMHMDRSCRMNSLPQYQVSHYVRKELNTPVLMFDANHMDQRYFSESQILNRFEAFMENINV